VNEISNGGLPTGWESVCLATLCQINPPLDRCVVNDAVEVNFVPMRAVESEGAGLVRPEVRPYGEVKKGYTSFLSGDVIMAKITPCMENGKTTVVPDLPGSVCFGSTEFHVIRPETGILPRWIASFLVHHDVRRNAQRAMTGGVGQMRVPAAFLESLRVPVAPTAEQERIADALTSSCPTWIPGWRRCNGYGTS
jgi:type I restriction enzyme S subunit